VDVGTVVVGVDGSEGAAAALRFAVAEAALRGVPLHVISAWEVPATAVAGGMVPTIALGDFEGAAEEAAEHAVAEAARLDADVECAGRAVHGPAAAVLAEAAGPDDLVVVGTRSRGGVAGLLLGSVSREVVHDARCPVVVVPSSVADGRR
jgi:nucleotide-binding universal stress UspA family protein